MRYSAFGVVVSKTWLFNQGGRPVINQANEEYVQLPDSLKYRHVRYEPHRGIDHAWEREWRIQNGSPKPVPSRMPWHFVVLEDLGIVGFDDYNL